MNYFAKIKYLGTHFSGFQVQPGLRTVQGELCTALEAALGAPCRVTGCSRTDAGVHAREFCIKVECDGATVPPEKLSVAVAKFLPNDLCLFYAKECENDFHPRYDAKSKEYLYRIINERVFDPFEFERAWFLPREITDEGLASAREAAVHFVGKKDFSAFMSEGSDATTTVRTVHYLEIDRTERGIDIRICADGFLYNMVRIIVGTLIEVIYGRKTPEDVAMAIASGERSRAGMTAPPEGLYLNSVNY
ncbi:MAG: tRNA pseudouridine(38-40) synthase TruA [Clostridia bacterium]|nr:tRNA pseudouridine(38-40) synthase TruA [Clostridia bacterium]